MLSISQENLGDVMAMRLSGAIDGGNSCRVIYDAIQLGLQADARKFIFDLTEVEWINSLGVGFLVAASVSATGQGAIVRLIGMVPRVATVLEASGIVPTIWRSYPSEQAALDSFQ